MGFSDRIMHPLFNLTKSLFRMLARVNKDMALKHMDEICDVLYHIKYQFIGDSIREEIEKCAKDFRPELKRRLKYIAPGLQTSKDAVDEAAESAAAAAAKKPRMMEESKRASADKIIILYMQAKGRTDLA